MTESDLCHSDVVENLRKNFRSGVMKTSAARETQLRQLHQMLTQHQSEFYEAVYKDMQKSQLECELLEISPILAHLSNALEKNKKWTKVKSVKPDLANIMNKCEIRQDPLGVALIVSSWYSPIASCAIPLIGALSAGNCVVLKTPDLSFNTSSLLKKLLHRYLSSDVIQVFNGGESETVALLQERFDVVFHSGSMSEAKSVMKAAAEHLTPVVLELRGKCPVVVDSTCNMDVIAQQIVAGKFANCGQTPVAPDYVICVGGCEETFLDSMKIAITKVYGEDVSKSDSYGRIICKDDFHRICQLIDPSKVIFGNDRDEEDLFLSPTLVTNVKEGDAVMTEEVFGPVLPVFGVENVRSAVDFINSQEDILHIYVFSNDASVVELTKEILFRGNVYVNSMLSHVLIPNLASQGAPSFYTFSHAKSCLGKSQGLEAVNKIRYPPYSSSSKLLKIAEKVLTPKV